MRGTKAEHLVVLISTEEGRRIIADLGPTKNLKDVQIATGDQISVMGPVVRISDRRILLAKKLRADGQTIRIRREVPSMRERGRELQLMQAKQVTGQIEKVAQLKVRGTDKKHTVVRLKTDEGRRIIADLGNPKDLRDIQVKSGQQMTLQGPMIHLSGKPVIIAEQISTDSMTAQIDRQFISALSAVCPDCPQAARGQGGTQTVRGEVLVSGEVLRVDRDGFYIVKDPSGREVHLLVSEEMNRGFQPGDQIKAQVRPDGQVTSIQKIQESGQSKASQSEQSRGQSGQSR
ncbi:MAG: hypothetical protein C4294_03815 [Nitrospiraceae bacterium]